MKPPKLLAGLAVASMALAACGTSSTSTNANKGTIKIGVDFPESGAETSNGVPALNGVKFAVSQVKSTDGYTLEVFNLDDAVGGVHDPAKGAQNMSQFVDDTKVLGVIGPFNSSVAKAEIPVTNRASMVQISPANTNPCLTKTVYIPSALSGGAEISCADGAGYTPSALRPTGTNNYFRVATTDDYQGPAVADYALNTLKLTKVAVASDNEAYGKGIADTFQARFKNKGGTVVLRQDFPNASHISDFRSFLQSAFSHGAQAVYAGGTNSNNLCVMRNQMKGIFPATAQFLGGDGLVNGDCLKDAADPEASGIFASIATVDASGNPAAAATIAGFKAAYPNAADFGAYTMPAYDATKILIQAIHLAIQANSGNMPSRAQVLAQMTKVDYTGVLGHTTFDANGDTTAKVISIYQSQATSAAGSTAPLTTQGSYGWYYVSKVDFTSGL
jgi:branched-chain amino acid transport system substrate-binding protein